MAHFVFWGILFISVILSVFSSFPFTLLVLLVFFARARRAGIGIGAFLAGIILDVLWINPLGQTSMLFLLLLLLASFYERKFEIATLPFVGAFSLIGSLVYFVAAGYEIGLVELAACVMFSVLLFQIFHPTSGAKNKNFI
ncbi:MAG: hypothetical protein A3J69_01665 [Candidatus Levybacteria bacterium RIFCSPHIGHO2_02_FULL_42_12]|nr:MAG: hypothetical protein A2698_02080 [Candidatus Levybacteria bacterium RIFCSPHIGHO2_01_FULL_42_15]OGH30769.1 MAG: hypothetical protein A3J69_01665 [Candidatus Levybacteria bacterium RIFCSPHIGHO2_02_FULL_42_12]